VGNCPDSTQIRMRRLVERCTGQVYDYLPRSTYMASSPWPTHITNSPLPTHIANSSWPIHMANSPWPTHMTSSPWPTHTANSPWPTHIRVVPWRIDPFRRRPAGAQLPEGAEQEAVLQQRRERSGTRPRGRPFSASPRPLRGQWEVAWTGLWGRFLCATCAQGAPWRGGGARLCSRRWWRAGGRGRHGWAGRCGSSAGSLPGHLGALPG
uniref:Uncharacterized protein n=1 Tax=Laticauda laticaudata TaxID=8630 RepID=A0A8C5SVD1_LATLA